MVAGSETPGPTPAPAAAAGWSAHPDAAGNEDIRAAAPQAAIGSARPVEVGAICRLRTSGSTTQQEAQSFAVGEYVLLEDGRRVTLHWDRGFTLGVVEGGHPSSGESPASITRDVLNTVLPDEDDSGEDHPWSWLAELARGHGIAVSAADLERLPYRVVLSDDVKQWLES